MHRVFLFYYQGVYSKKILTFVNKYLYYIYDIDHVRRYKT